MCNLGRVPRWYGEKMRRKIQAGAGVENLRLRCPYFYDVALALHATDGAPSVADLVISTFRSRYKVSQRPCTSSAPSCPFFSTICMSCQLALLSLPKKTVEPTRKLRLPCKQLLSV